MKKKKRDLVIEQVMDDLNKEMHGSLHSSPNLLIPDLTDESHVSEQRAQDQEMDSLIHFAPHETSKKAKSNKLKKQDKSHLSKKPLFSAFSNKKSELQQKASPEFFSGKLKASQQAKATLVQKKQQNVNASYDFGASDQDVPMRITLKQSENLRVAQERIVALETEIERLRKENEELIATGDIFKERLDKVIVQNDNLKKIYEESREEFQDEKKTLMDALNDQKQEIEKSAVKNKELEKRLSNNIQQIRVRERELENRLELMKLDNQTLTREKDQYILDLKRQLDRLKMDLDSQKSKYNEESQKMDRYRDQHRNATRGLQMVLHILRGSDFSQEQQEIKKEE